MHEILSLLERDEIREALWLLGVFERWSMPAEEADEWRRRIGRRNEFMRLNGTRTH